MFDSNPVPLYDPNRCSFRSPAFGKTEGYDAAHVLKRKMSCTFFSTKETDTNERSRIRVSRLLSDRVSPRTAAPLSPDDVWPRGTRSVPHLAPIASSQNRLGLAAPTPLRPVPALGDSTNPPSLLPAGPPALNKPESTQARPFYKSEMATPTRSPTSLRLVAPNCSRFRFRFHLHHPREPRGAGAGGGPRQYSLRCPRPDPLDPRVRLTDRARSLSHCLAWLQVLRRDLVLACCCSGGGEDGRGVGGGGDGVDAGA